MRPIAASVLAGIALVEELDSDRPLKAVRLLGQDFVLFRDEAGRYGMIDHGLRLTAPRRTPDGQAHVRVTHLLFQQAFAIPLSSEMTIIAVSRADR